ncbi:protein-L-isoaspartate O-methyltransferase [Halovivax sp.]|uniref:protein-L-isoaspartate O-methyltransferase family protein n=1 Tax=Halovivax sp. TaxID=1935978 RepID=UPI0025C508CC|nr:protein-L-isoaspartate O-methyltransferase [Halovivax sp.]
MDPAVLRDDMVAGLEHEAKGHVRSDRVASAMRSVPREPFVEDERTAYQDRDQEFRGTRVLAPSTVARLIEALDVRADDDLLVVGAGVGYTAAVLAEMVGAQRVHAVDITRPVVYAARQNLAEAGYDAVLVDCRDGGRGLPEYAPFDRILVEAAAIEPPRALLDQLAPGGRLVIPLGSGPQTLVAVEDGDIVAEFGSTSFDPLLVEGEQADALERNRTAREERERARQSRGVGWELDWIDWEDD